MSNRVTEPPVPIGTAPADARPLDRTGLRSNTLERSPISSSRPDGVLRVALPMGNDLDAMARGLRQQGAKVHRFSEAAADSGARPLESWILELFEGAFDDVVFFTAQGVRLIVEFSRQLDREEEVVRALGTVRKITQGPKPSSALSEVGLRAEIISASATPESLMSTLAGLDLHGRTVGIATLRPDLRLIDLLDKKGAIPRVLSRTVESDAALVDLLERVLRGEFDGLAWSSPSQVERLWEVASARGASAELRAALANKAILALSPAVELALRQLGVHSTPLPSKSLLVRPRPAELSELFSSPTNGHVNGDAATQGGPVATVPRSRGKQTVVVIGNGMVGFRLCERLTELDTAQRLQVVVFCEEPRPAYDRVALTSYFQKESADELLLAPAEWYRSRGIRLLLGERAVRVDRKHRLVSSSSGEVVHYDSLVFATGSLPFVPPLPGIDKQGVFVYRTIEDLDRIREASVGAKRAVVLGGGLLGLEAAKAVLDFGLETHVVEVAPRLMPRQLDAGGARLLRKSIEALGVGVHVGRQVAQVVGDDRVTGVEFNEGAPLETDLLIVSAGIRPRDDLAREAGLDVGDRGGILVDDALRTSDGSVYAVGECALHRGTLYGLVAPGYAMAEALAQGLTGHAAKFSGADQSSKLKLLGVAVASLGDPFADATGGRSVVLEDLVRGVYKKVVVSEDRTELLGAVLVGDTDDYTKLATVLKGSEPLPDAPEELIVGLRNGASGTQSLGDNAQICSCNNVSKSDICLAIRQHGCESYGAIKQKTRAGTGCGGCAPLVQEILNAELKAAGQNVKQVLCEHFAFTRQELYQIVRVKKTKTFQELLSSHGTGAGCEICKPAVASILASVHNELIVDGERATLQDTNDRYLANMQRGGLYSVVPRIAGGEVTPEQLIELGRVAKKFDLYTKITGGQRIDMFGARVDQLPEIWEELVNSGFESGHAYGKAMRTVKSCVGTTWCRFGVQDSVKFAIRVENRYKGVRAPHKLKSAVSGCTRECAEAQSKDFGLIATEKGWNLYVCGNGGMKPKHAILLASDIDEDTAIRYIDRFLMYYIATADRLTRTATWLDKLEGGIEHLKDVIVTDRLGIAAELETQMQYLVDTYRCEWAEVVKNPELRQRFKHFANTKEPDDSVAMLAERGQKRPRDWQPVEAARVRDRRHLPLLHTSWVKVGRVEDFPENGGMAVRYGAAQIAVYNFSSRGEWYASQNMCPHMQDMVLSRGLLGDQKGVPKVACPQHKKTFSLKNGDCLSGEQFKIRTFPVRVERGEVYVELPDEREIEKLVPAKSLEFACPTAAE